MNHYHIYAKGEEDTKFQALDWSAGKCVSNLIHATLVPESNLEKAKEALTAWKGVEPKTELQIRHSSTKEIIFTA